MIEHHEIAPEVEEDEDPEKKRFRVDVYMPKEIPKKEWDFIHGDKKDERMIT
jgi:hypothetical protein